MKYKSRSKHAYTSWYAVVSLSVSFAKSSYKMAIFSKTVLWLANTTVVINYRILN
jgi:hypothetical protein